MNVKRNTLKEFLSTSEVNVVCFGLKLLCVNDRLAIFSYTGQLIGEDSPIRLTTEFSFEELQKMNK